MNMIAIVDYGMGNLRSVAQALRHFSKSPLACFQVRMVFTRARLGDFMGEVYYCGVAKGGFGRVFVGCRTGSLGFARDKFQPVLRRRLIAARGNIASKNASV